MAEPFGFGPIASTIAFVRQIRKVNPEKKCIFLGCGTAYQLAVKSNIFDATYFGEDFSETSLAQSDIRIERNNCIVIANTYPKGVAFAKRIGFSCLFIDTLFWMWNELPINISDVKKYYIEDFHCIDLKIDRFSHSNKFKIIPPLIDLDVEPYPVSHPFLLVTLGGIDSDLYDFPMFYEKLIKYISEEKKLHKYTIIICGGGKKFSGNEFKQYEHSRLTITCLGHNDLIAYLKSADIVLASPGLHGIYENFYLKKNVMFLPPQNYSQYLQLNYIMKNFPKVVGTNFEQLGISHNLRENMPDLERIQQVKYTRKALGENENILRLFFDTFEKFYTGNLQTDWANEKNDFKENENGPFILANEILAYINHPA